MRELNAALQWLTREAKNTSFGVVGLSVIIHGGKIKRIEKSITEKEQIMEKTK